MARNAGPGTEIPDLKVTLTSVAKNKSSWEASLIPKIPLIIQRYSQEDDMQRMFL